MRKDPSTARDSTTSKERGKTPKHKRTDKRRSFALRLVLWLITLGLCAALLGGVTLVGLFYYYGRGTEIPRLNTIREYHPPVVSRIFDRHHVLLGEISAERRTVVPVSRIPQQMIQAVVAAEDDEFFKHRGLDYWGMLRAFFANLRAGHFVQGGSTITQQVVKTFVLSPERTIRRKIQEVLLARRLESELTKEEILYLYLNQIYFGHGRYGVEEASRFYFGRGVDKLDLAGMALLAGLPQSPERLSPFKHPRAAKRRQVYVLNRMAALKMISATAAQKLIESPIQVVRRHRASSNEAPEFLDIVRSELAREYGEQELSKAGLQVKTTLDLKLQRAAREAVQWGLTAIDARQRYRRRVTQLKGKRLIRTLAALKKKQLSFEEGKHYQAVVTLVDDEGEKLTVDLGRQQGTVLLDDDDRYNPHHQTPSQRFSPGDLIWVRCERERFRFDGGPQVALVALDPITGEVLAMIGGYDFQAGNYNRAIQALRQPGSAFKPFVYAAALESGRFTPASLVEDAPVTFSKWEPKNYDGIYLGPVRLRQALALSINTVAAKLIAEVGVEPVRTLATEMGITAKLGRDLSLALGSSEVSVLDMARAYGALANGGRAITPQYISRIGEHVLKPTEGKQVLSPEVAFLVVSLMESVVEEGTARRALRLRRAVAGKTGTTNSLRDAWFVGFTPQLVTAVWVGFDHLRYLGRGETGSRAALPIWLRFMEKALAGKPRLSFRPPPGVTVKRIDTVSGLLAPEGATRVLDEYFLIGTEPTEYALPPNPDIPLEPYPAPDPTDPNHLLPPSPPAGGGQPAPPPTPPFPVKQRPTKEAAPIPPLGRIPLQPGTP